MNFPKLRRLETKEDLNLYGRTYEECSGLPVPEFYLKNLQNRVYAIELRGQMIGGFILGNGVKLRTIEVFAQAEKRRQLYTEIGNPFHFTEICCFWISPDFRMDTLVNLFIWVSLAFTLKIHSAKNILFGTCSSSLARLYGVTPKSVLFHQDRVNGKRTFIFHSKRKTCLMGFYEIIRHKLQRAQVIKRQFARRMAVSMNN